MTTTIRIRRDTSSAWAGANPVVAGGEFALETDTGLLKIGNGATPWLSLPYEVSRAALQQVLDALTGKYTRPSGGIPASDLAAAVVASLAKADAAATPAQVQAKFDALIAGAPGLLDTLDELAAALGDDPNAIATLTAAIAAKYTRPAGGVPVTDLSTAAQASLARADAAATPAQVQAKFDALVAGAPGLLDTLDELAAALGDDPNAIATLSTAIAGKYAKPSGGIPSGDLAAAVVASLAKADAAATPAQVQAKFDALVAGAPGLLDTLDELAAALGDDPNAIATLTTAIGARYTKPSSGIPLTDVATAAAASLRDRSTHTGTQATSTVVGLDAALTAMYVKPSTGIPESHLASSISTKLAEDVTQGQLTDAIAGIVAGAPTNLRTLAEFAGALGEDGNLSGNLEGLLAQKVTKTTGGIPASDLSQPVRDALVSVASNTAAIAALQVTVDQILNPPAAPPTAITLTATAGDGQVTLTRTGGESTTSSGAGTSTAYALYRGTDATGTLLTTKLPYTDTGRTNGTGITYFVTAKNNAGTVSASATATPAATPLPTPTFAFRAADITGVADLGAVASAPAGFGAGPAWAQTDTTLQPSYRAAYNGRPAIYCAGGALRSVSGIAYSSRGFAIGRVWFDSAPNSTTDQGIAASDDGPISNAVRLWRLSGAKAGLLKGIAWNSGTARTDTASGLTGGAWRVVAVRWGGGSVETFIDGVSDGATAGTVSTTGTRTVLLGASYISSGAITEPMKGYINEFRGYYQALTTAEVDALFADMGVVRS